MSQTHLSACLVNREVYEMLAIASVTANGKGVSYGLPLWIFSPKADVQKLTEIDLRIFIPQSGDFTLTNPGLESATV